MIVENTMNNIPWSYPFTATADLLEDGSGILLSAGAAMATTGRVLMFIPNPYAQAAGGVLMAGGTVFALTGTAVAVVSTGLDLLGASFDSIMDKLFHEDGTNVDLSDTAVLNLFGGVLEALFSNLVGKAEASTIDAKLDILQEDFDTPKPSPLVLDLDGDGIELTALDGSSAYFDLNINGFAELTGWVSPDDALLALDVNGDGIINDGSELFGDQTGHDHGFLALAVHDDNGDGVIDASDAVFSDLLVWQDFNGDGISQSGEMMSLLDAGVASINLNAAAVDYDIAGNDVLWETTFTRTDGSTSAVVDAFFATDQVDTVALLPEGFEYHADAFKLPVLAGMGQMASTLVSLSQDDALRQEAADLVALASTGDIAGFMAGFEDFLYSWAGVSDVAEGSRGLYVDAQSLAMLEVIFGQDFEQAGGNSPTYLAGRDLNEGFDALVSALAVQFLAQVPTSNAMLNVDDTTDFSTLLTSNPLAGLADVITDPDAAAQMMVDLVDAGTLSVSDAALLLNHIAVASDAETAAFNGAVSNAASASGTAAAVSMAWMVQELSESDYRFSSGDGDQTIVDYRHADGKLVLTDVASNDVTFGRSGESLTLTMPDGAVITVDRHFNTGETLQLDAISFSDGVSLDLQGIRNRTVEDQKDSGAVIGSKWAETFAHSLGDGSYTISDHRSSGDVLSFTDQVADDVTFTQDGDNLVVTLSNGETVTVLRHFSSSGTDDIGAISFSDGTVLSNADIAAKMAADMIASPVWQGTAGSDTFTYYASYGDKRIIDYGTSYYANDELIFADVASDAVTFSQNEDQDLIITLETGEVITVEDHFRGTSYDMERITFSDGVTLDVAGIDARVRQDADAPSGPVIGTSGADVFIHETGFGSYTIEDYGTAWYVKDRLIFSDVSASEATFSRSGSFDLAITTAAGEVVILKDHYRGSNYDMEFIEFADGTVLDTQGIRDKAVADQKSSGVINGSVHLENFVHTSGDGSYTINDYGNYWNVYDRLTFTDMTVDQMTFSQNAGKDLVITMDNGEVVTITDHFLGSNYDMEFIEFADGTVLDAQGIRDKAAKDQMSSGFVQGSVQKETFVHEEGDGSYTVDDYGNYWNVKDVFEFKDMDETDVLFEQNADQDLVMHMASGETVTILDHFRGSNFDMEVIRFSDGTELDTSTIAAKTLEDEDDMAAWMTTGISPFEDNLV